MTSPGPSHSSSLSCKSHSSLSSLSSPGTAVNRRCLDERISSGSRCNLCGAAFPSFSRMTPSISRCAHEIRYDSVDDHGPRSISFGWESSPRLDLKKAQEMISPTWTNDSLCSSRGAGQGVALGVAIDDMLRTDENGKPAGPPLA